jgi:hypothetical protein
MRFKLAAAAWGAAMGIALALHAALAADPTTSPAQVEE